MIKNKYADILRAIADGKDTDLAVSGARHFAEKIEYRVAREKEVLRYKVAKMKDKNGQPWIALATCVGEEHGIECDNFFIEWATDWQKVEFDK